ncbi:restriction endonuclease subunit S, partial [Kaistella sp.]|uniref:restriction endonuclease subunit S n=1 Tax=Kaistella sp. TaxID=2782235 RepID=UPI002F958E08
GNGIRGYTTKFNREGTFPLIGRQGALCGNVNYSSGKFWATEHALLVSPLKVLNLRYFGELLEIMNLNQYSVASAQPGLSVERLLDLEISTCIQSDFNSRFYYKAEK